MQAHGGFGAVRAILGQFLQTRLARGDKSDLGHGKHTIKQDQQQQAKGQIHMRRRPVPARMEGTHEDSTRPSQDHARAVGLLQINNLHKFSIRP